MYCYIYINDILATKVKQRDRLTIYGINTRQYTIVMCVLLYDTLAYNIMINYYDYKNYT